MYDIEIDAHGLTCREMYTLLKEVDINESIATVKIITGSGRHSRRPTMDYYCTTVWKNPLKETILHFIIYEKNEGSRITEYPNYIVWRKSIHR